MDAVTGASRPDGPKPRTWSPLRGRSQGRATGPECQAAMRVGTGPSASPKAVQSDRGNTERGDLPEALVASMPEGEATGTLDCKQRTGLFTGCRCVCCCAVT